MKIVNQTHWRTDHLKAILQRVAEMELEPEKRRRVVVTVSYSGVRRDSSSGHAALGGTRAKVRIPKGVRRDCSDEADAMRSIKLAFASVASHEFAHLRGMSHRQMPSYYKWSGDWTSRVLWAADMPLEVKPKPVRKAVDVQEVRHAQVVALEKKWQTKLKLAQTKLRKLRTRRRYYEKALAARAANRLQQGR